MVEYALKGYVQDVLRSDPDVARLPLQGQIEYFQTAALPYDIPEFASAPPEKQAAIIENEIKPLLVQTTTQPVEMPEIALRTRQQMAPMQLANPISDALDTVNYYAGGLVDQVGNPFGLRDAGFKALGWQTPEQQQMATAQRLNLNQGYYNNPITRLVREGVGMIAPGMATEALAAKGLYQGGKLLSRIPAVTSNPVGRSFVNTLGGAGNKLAQRMMTGAAGFGLYSGLDEGVRSGFNPQQTMQGVVEGAALGAGFPLVGKAVKTVAGGIGKAFAKNAGRELVGLSGLARKQVSYSAEALQKEAAKLQGLVEEIRAGKLQVSDEDIVRISDALSKVEQAAMGGNADYARLAGGIRRLVAKITKGPKMLDNQRAAMELAQLQKQAAKVTGKARERIQGRIERLDRQLNPKPEPVAETPTLQGKVEKTVEGDTTFKTSQGSTYTLKIDKEGRAKTTRNKTLHQGHDPKDVGLKAESERTVFIDPKYQGEADIIYTSGHKSRDIWVDDETKTLHIKTVMQDNGQGQQRIIEKKIPFNDIPSQGQQPFEIWNDGKKAHLGNKITELKAGAGKSDYDKAKELHAELQTFGKGSRDPRAKEIRAELDAVNDGNLRPVLDTEHDMATGIGKQNPVDPEKQLTFDAVKDSIQSSFKGLAKKIDRAMQDGNKIRVQYRAEEAGRSNEVVRQTAKGEITEAITEFTPTNWYKTKDGKVMVEGYNQRGHDVRYHLEPSTNGSQVVKVTKVTNTPGFAGTKPNVYKGAGEYKIADVLERGPRSEGGEVKSSEAIDMVSQLNELLKAWDTPNTPKLLKNVIRSINKRRMATSGDLAKLRDLIDKNMEALKAACSIWGLK